MFAKRLFWTGLFFFCFLTAPQSYAEQIVIENAWAMATAPGAPNGAAYMVIKNNGPVDDHLVGVETDATKKAGIHQTVMNGGMMEMHPVKSITVPAGKSVELKPGGYHVMIMGLKKPLKMGGELHLTLKFRKAGEIKATAPIKKGGKSMKMK